jgi:hypothetical protein
MEYLLTILLQIFVLDDVSSMGTHWNDVCFLLKPLAYLSKRMDCDGLEIYAANHHDNPRTYQHSSKIVSFAEQHKPKEEQQLTSNLTRCLSKIFKKLLTYPPDERRTIIYILTNADWPGQDPPCILDGVIRRFAKKLEAKRTDITEVLGIQFIFFGKTANAESLMAHLDNLPDHHGDIDR